MVAAHAPVATRMANGSSGVGSRTRQSPKLTAADVAEPRTRLWLHKPEYKTYLMTEEGMRSCATSYASPCYFEMDHQCREIGALVPSIWNPSFTGGSNLGPRKFRGRKQKGQCMSGPAMKAIR